ncbi:MAG: Flp pilus assembly protein CpaB [Anaerolineae bacterium]|uniref:Flp pilus assembly protein CpaB n=1 Tax=Thermogutta sp. TaxID=1962930 RepID=UPI0032204316
MKSKGIRALAVTVGGGLLVFLLMAAFLGSLRNTQPTVVAVRPLPAGARLTADVLAVREIHASARLPNALSDVKDADGQVLTVARATGDQITADMLGEQAAVGVAAQLEPGHRAIAVRVSQASGLAGVIRPGDRVAVVAIIDPQQSVELLSPISEIPIPSETTEKATGITTATLSAPSTVAYVVVSGLRVLLVPQSFRYEEVLPEEDSSGLFTIARTTASSQRESVILLDVPVEPVEVAGVQVSPATLLPLLDAKSQIYLLLEPVQDDGIRITTGTNLGELYQAVLESTHASPPVPALP